MILQNIIWPKKGVCTEEKLYFHANVIDEDFNIDRDENHKKSNMNYVNYQRISEIKGGGLSLDRFGKVAFDTYFNGLSIEKWKKYTIVNQVSATVEIEGHFLITLCSKIFLHGEVIKKELAREEFNASKKTRYSLSFENADKGMLYFEIESLEDGSVFYGGYYEDTAITEAVRQPKIGIDICTNP